MASERLSNFFWNESHSFHPGNDCITMMSDKTPEGFVMNAVYGNDYTDLNAWADLSERTCNVLEKINQAKPEIAQCSTEMFNETPISHLIDATLHGDYTGVIEWFELIISSCTIINQYLPTVFG